MGTILNNIVPNRKVEVRIIKDGFSSPVLGLTYIGQVKILNIATAKALVNAGICEFVDEKEGGKKAKSPAKVIEPETQEDEVLTLEDAIKSLDPDDSAHWTKNGLPDLNVLKELTGEHVKRSEVEDVAPEYTREFAAENKV